MRKYAIAQLLGTVANLFIRQAGDTTAIDLTIANDSIVNGRTVTVFAPVTLIGSQAEFLKDRLEVGKTVFAAGDIRQENWEKVEDGKTRKYSRLKVAATRIELIEGDFALTEPKADQKSKPRLADGINSATIAGNLTASPIMRNTVSNDDVCNFTVAMNRKFKDRDGNDQEETAYVEVTLWREQAVKAYKQLKKGDAVIVTGHLVTETWRDRDDKPRQSLRVEGQRFFCVAGAPRNAAPAAEPEVTEGDLPPLNPDEVPSEDLPF